MTRQKAVGLVLGGFGSLLLAAHDVFTLIQHMRDGGATGVLAKKVLGFGCATVASLSYAGASVYAGKHVSKDVHWLVVAVVENGMGFAFISVSMVWEFFYPAMGYPPHLAFFLSMSAQTVYSILYLGVGVTAVALAAFFYVLRRSGPLVVNSAGYLVPVVAVIIGAVFNGELSHMPLIVKVVDLVALAITISGCLVLADAVRKAGGKGEGTDDVEGDMSFLMADEDAIDEWETMDTVSTDIGTMDF